MATNVSATMLSSASVWSYNQPGIVSLVWYIQPGIVSLVNVVEKAQAENAEKS